MVAQQITDQIGRRVFPPLEHKHKSTDARTDPRTRESGAYLGCRRGRPWRRAWASGAAPRGARPRPAPRAARAPPARWRRPPRRAARGRRPPPPRTRRRGGRPRALPWRCCSPLLAAAIVRQGEARKRRRRAEARGQRVDRYILGGPNTFSSNRIENFRLKKGELFLEEKKIPKCVATTGWGEWMVGPGWASRCVDLRVAAAFSLLVSKIDFFFTENGFYGFWYGVCLSARQRCGKRVLVSVSIGHMVPIRRGAS
jgi:hypothetical protein